MSSNELANVIANRTALSLARSERLIASWLPTPVGEADGRTGAEADEPEGETFVQEPELSGLGFRKANDSETGHGKVGSTHADNELRKRLLGKRKRPEDKVQARGAHGFTKPRPHNGSMAAQAVEEDSGDEEEGRSGVGKARRQDSQNLMSHTDPPDDEVVVPPTTDPELIDPAGPMVGKRPRARTALDEVLEENAQKRKRNKKKKKNKTAVGEGL